MESNTRHLVHAKAGMELRDPGKKVYSLSLRRLQSRGWEAAGHRLF